MATCVCKCRLLIEKDSASVGPVDISTIRATVKNTNTGAVYFNNVGNNTTITGEAANHIVNKPTSYPVTCTLTAGNYLSSLQFTVSKALYSYYNPEGNNNDGRIYENYTDTDAVYHGNSVHGYIKLLVKNTVAVTSLSMSVSSIKSPTGTVNVNLSGAITGLSGSDFVIDQT